MIDPNLHNPAFLALMASAYEIMGAFGLATLYILITDRKAIHAPLCLLCHQFYQLSCDRYKPRHDLGIMSEYHHDPFA